MVHTDPPGKHHLIQLYIHLFIDYSTYKRLISDQHGNEEPPSYSDEVSVTNNDHHKGICR